VIYPDRSDKYSYTEYNRLCEEAQNNCPEYVNYWKDFKEWSDKCEILGKDVIALTLPAETTLKVDRIYIRKGASDYSSVTFFASGLGEVLVKPRWIFGSGKEKKKKSLRFWAKLADCNNIEFE
jgi:hypothetical protein